MHSNGEGIYSLKKQSVKLDRAFQAAAAAPLNVV